MMYIRKRILQGEVVSGTFLQLGSAMAAEVAGKAGLDWVVLDCEHGAGGFSELVAQLHAVGCTKATPVVRVAWNEVHRFKRVLDVGASGVMVPYINNADEARQAVAAMRYPLEGVRGVSMLTRSCDFGMAFGDYFAAANRELVTMLQIETPQAIENIDAIAAVDGADVMFVGPADLCTSMGFVMDLNNPTFQQAAAKVIEACKRHGKAAGILLRTPELVEQYVAKGFTVIGVGSDGGFMRDGALRVAAAVKEARSKQRPQG